MDAGKNESNPFSFKSFLKRGEGPPAGTATSAAAVSKKGGSRKKGSLKKDQGEPFPVLDEEDTGIMRSTWFETPALSVPLPTVHRDQEDKVRKSLFLYQVCGTKVFEGL